jgi:hypothetical protein
MPGQVWADGVGCCTFGGFEGCEELRFKDDLRPAAARRPGDYSSGRGVRRPERGLVHPNSKTSGDRLKKETGCIIAMR